jgi:hypothetical protein
LTLASASNTLPRKRENSQMTIKNLLDIDHGIYRNEGASKSWRDPPV